MNATPTGQHTVALPRSASSARVARAWAAPLLAGWGLDGQMDDVLLIVSELVANAVMHGTGEVRVALTPRPGGILHIEVCDDASGSVEVVHGETDRPSGRGLLIVEALAERWGVDAGPDGKAVWAELRVAAS